MKVLSASDILLLVLHLEAMFFVPANATSCAVMADYAAYEHYGSPFKIYLPFFKGEMTPKYANFYKLPLIWMHFDGCTEEPYNDPTAPTLDDIAITFSEEGAADMPTVSATGTALDNNLVSVQWDATG